MYLVIDIGNTYTKIGCFQDEKIIKKYQIENIKVTETEALSDITPTDYVIISSVNTLVFEVIKKKIIEKTEKILVFNQETKIPIENKYSSKETLGLDRLAGIIGANSLYKNTNILVFDAGTALTVDYINDKNEYLGGNISPGLNTRFKALHNYTSKLPLVEKSEDFPQFGKTTNEAILSGVQQGIIYEIDSYINDFKNNYKNNTVILTGGDTFFFEKRLKNTIFANSDLVLIGLHKVLKFNV